MKFRKHPRHYNYYAISGEAPEISVVAAGSLLESLFIKDIGSPVGRVEYLIMHPVSFPEFLEALGETSALEALLRIPFPGYALKN